MRKPQIVVIVGPTASGKSALAVRLAKKFNGEIISADSRQVYRGLDIGSGKIPGRWVSLPPTTTILLRPYKNGSSRATHKKAVLAERFFIYKNISHHCIDFVPPRRTYTVAEFEKCAAAAISKIAGRRRIPFLVGGTAFWVNTVAYGYRLPEVRPNPALRRRLSAKIAAELFATLKKLDPTRASAIEQKNPRRLIRAIEIARALGRVPPLEKHTPYRALWLGPRPSRQALSRTIRKRVKGMLRRGLIAETKRLLASGVGKKRIWEFGFEYRAVLDYLEKLLPKDELETRIAKDTLAYAARQMRWWKRNPEIHWIVRPADAERLIKKFLQKSV